MNSRKGHTKRPLKLEDGMEDTIAWRTDRWGYPLVVGYDALSVPEQKERQGWRKEIKITKKGGE